MHKFNSVQLVTVAVALMCAARAQGQDLVTGEKLFKTNCSICHSPQPGKDLTGPSLFAVVNRHSGQIPGFHYSEANKNSGLVWNVATLDRYLAAPRELVPGTKMTFPGLKDPKQRSDVIAYLATLR